MRRVLIFDTSVLCCWLQVPGKETAGPVNDKWDHKRISGLVEQEARQKSIFVLPIATLIETGNHIAQAPERRFECATKMAVLLRNAADDQTPWAAFTEQSSLWEPTNLRALADKWPVLANTRLSIGDATIKDVAEYYARIGCEVEIVTGDEGLKAYEPIKSPPVPRRRR